VLLVLYKLGDAFAGSLTTAFLLRGAGFSLDDVGYVNKAVGSPRPSSECCSAAR